MTAARQPDPDRLYRKQGESVRWENGAMICVRESGRAWEDGELFVCEPEPWIDDGSRFCDEGQQTLQRLAESVSWLARGAGIERLIVAEGVATHRFGERSWSEHTRRIHLSLLRQRQRVLLDLASFDDLSEVTEVAGVLSGWDGRERPAPQCVRLAPRVTAALLPSFIQRPPDGARIVQAGGGVDGYGEAIEDAAQPPWPSSYRPSYRTRPVARPMNLRVEPDSGTAIDASLPLAVALLGRASDPPGPASRRMLVLDRGVAYAAAIPIGRVLAAGPPRSWYPYGGGSFGAEMML